MNGTESPRGKQVDSPLHNLCRGRPRHSPWSRPGNRLELRPWCRCIGYVLFNINVSDRCLSLAKPLVTPESHEQRCVMARRTGRRSGIDGDGGQFRRREGWKVGGPDRRAVSDSRVACACTIESCVCVARWLYQAYDGRGIGSGQGSGKAPLRGDWAASPF